MVIPWLLLLLILMCNFHSNCPHSVQSNSIRFASQVEKLSRFLLPKCDGRTHFLSSPGADVLLKANKEEAEVFIWHKPGLPKAAWGRAALSALCRHPSLWAATAEDRTVILGETSGELVCGQSPVSARFGSQVLTVWSLEHLGAHHCASAAFSHCFARNSLAVIEKSDSRVKKKTKFHVLPQLNTG